MTVAPIPVGRPRDLENYRDRIHRLAPDSQRALDHIAEQRALLPDLVAQVYDGPAVHASGITDRTAAIAGELDRLDRKRIDILDAIAVIGKAVKVCEDACADARRTRADIPNQTPVEPTVHTERTCIGYTNGPECNDLPDYHFDQTGTIVVHDRCGRCEAAQGAHEARKAVDAARKRAERHGLKETA